MALLGTTLAKPETPPKLSGSTKLILQARRVRALRAILGWLKGLDNGTARDIADYAKEHGLSKRQLLSIISTDTELQKRLFEPAMMEARLGVNQAITEAVSYLGSEDLDPAKKLGWAEFLAKFTGGGFERRREGGPSVLINLVPELPYQYKQIEAKIIDMPRPQSLDELGG